MLGQEVEEYVIQQIRARQNLYNNAGNRSQTKLNVLSNQNAWVKLASGVALESEAQRQSLKKSKTASFQKSGNPITFQIPTPEFDKLYSQLTPEAKEKISKLNLPTAKVDDKEVQINKNSFLAGLVTNIFNVKAFLFFVSLFTILVDSINDVLFYIYPLYFAITSCLWFLFLSYVTTISKNKNFNVYSNKYISYFMSLVLCLISLLILIRAFYEYF